MNQNSTTSSCTKCTLPMIVSISPCRQGLKLRIYGQLPTKALSAATLFVLQSLLVRVVANSEMSSGVMSHTEPITPSRRLAFTVRRCQLPRLPCCLVVHRPSAICPCLYINNLSPIVLHTQEATTLRSIDTTATSSEHSHISQQSRWRHTGVMELDAQLTALPIEGCRVTHRPPTTPSTVLKVIARRPDRRVITLERHNASATVEKAATR